MAKVETPEEFAMKEQANAIIDACLGVKHDTRADGYQNMLTKYGTKQDSSTAYHFMPEADTDDYTLSINYQYNGLFSKIIDLPAEEAVAKGFKLNIDDTDVEKAIMREFNNLDWEEKFGQAIKWARLYGGALIVMVINDGRGIDEPLNFKAIRGIEEIRVYESAVVNPISFIGLNMEHPEVYQVSSIYGTFSVHHSRCLVIKNNKLPEFVSNEKMRYWGGTEYDRIRTSLRETVTTHGYAPKLLERAAQSVFGIKNLAELLSTEDGENAVVRRLQALDMSRSMFNSIALDADGETFSITSSPYNGVQEIINSTYNMLSAVTNIPQTLLFGNSPQGMNATGHSDLENYYNYVNQIQKRMLKKSLKRLTDVIIKSMCAVGKIEDVPDYELEFNPLWSLSDMEQAQVDSMKEQVKLTRAQIASTYVQMGALDPTEVRAALASTAEYDIETMLDNVPEDEFFDDLMERAEQQQQAGGGDMGAMGGAPGGDMAGMPDMSGGAGGVPTPEMPQIPQGDEKSIDNSEKSGKMINADGAPYGNDNAAKGHTQNPGNRMPRGTVNDYNEAKKAGNVVMKYKAGKQAKHRKGSKEYEEAVAKGYKVSTIDISDEEIQKIVESKTGSKDNRIYYDKGKKTVKEVINAGKIIGTCIDEDGNAVKTNCFTVHHSSTGYHVVPSKPRGLK